MKKRFLVFLVALAPIPVAAQTADEWIRLGEQVHGGFGSLIALGIRVGQDAQKRLDAGRRELEVLYLDGPATPCPCAADGILVATSASPGQKTLNVAAEKAAPGLLAEVRFRHRKTGQTAVYRIPMSVMPRMAQWNRELDSRGRFEAVMAAEPSSLFTAE